MNRRFAFLYTLAIAIGINSAVAAKTSTFHWGNSLIYAPGPVTGDYFYALYDLKADNPIFEGDIEFLEEHVPALEHGEWLLEGLEPVRTFKLIGIDSIFVHRYEGRAGLHNSIFLLSDTKRDRRILLNNISPESFSFFWSDYFIEDDNIDYIFLSRLYLVFCGMDKYIYFVEDAFDTGIAHAFAGGPGFQNSSGLTSKDLIDSGAEWAKRITAPCIRRKAGHIEVELYAYVLDEVKVYRYLFYYKDSILKYVEKEFISPTKPPQE